MAKRHVQGQRDNGNEHAFRRAQKGDLEAEYEPSVTAGSVLCCLLFLVLILLGIALIIAGATVYVENDGYMKMRIKALTEMCDRWGKECEAKMNTAVSEKLRLTVKSGSKVTEGIKTTKETLTEIIPEVDPKVSINVTYVQANVYTSRDADTLDVQVYAKGKPETHLAEALGVPLRREIDVPAVCNTRLLHKYCTAEDMCGKLTFKGDLKGCVDKKECGRCKGSGYLSRVCVIGDFCSSSAEKVELTGCEYPFQPDSQYYAVLQPTRVKVTVFDVNTPSIMKQLILSGSDIDAPSTEQAASRKKGKILFGVGIPVLVLALFSLVVLCAYRHWWCFDNGDDDHVHSHADESWNESAIPMHGLAPQANSKQSYACV